MRLFKLFTAATLLASGLSAAAFPDPPAPTQIPTKNKAVAVLAGGCFWGVEGVFERVKGVLSTEVGYSGGSEQNAHYEIVSNGDTGHAESVKVTYDPTKVSYGQILKIFFSVVHDPTTLNRQHNDVGTQYRSHIFYTDSEQKKVAEAYIKQLNEARVFRNPVVTRLTPLDAFYPAEGYHQKYLDNNPTQPYIANMDMPKIEDLKRTFPDWYRPVPLKGGK